MFKHAFIDGLGPRFWYHLRCFSSVISLKNYAKAAHHLHLSPSSVTRAIQDLEKDLKVSLFERGGKRRLQLTPQGDQLYAHSLALFGQLIALESCLYASGEKVAFSLNLALPEWVLCDYLLSPLVQFKVQCPDFRVAFFGSPQKDGDPNPELRIVLGLHSKTKGLIQKPLKQWQLFLYASNRYRERFGDPRCIDDLKDHLCLAWQISDPTLAKILNWHCLSSPTFILGSSTALIKMAQMDQGMMSCFRGHPALKDSGLLELGKELCDEQAPRLGLYLVGEPACWAQAEVQALYQHLKQFFEENRLSMIET